MRNDDQSARESWAKSLAQSRKEQGLSELELARELLMSPAQLRDIERASLQSFHGIGFYHRAVQRLADRLGVPLDPPIESTLAASEPAATKNAQLTKQSDTLAKRPPLRPQGVVLPTQGSSRNPVRLLMGLVIIIAVSAGVYVSLVEGWPFKQPEEPSQSQSPALKTAPNATEEVEPRATNPSPANGVSSSPERVAVEVIEPQIVTTPQTTPPIPSADNRSSQASTTDNRSEAITESVPTQASVSASASESVLESTAEPTPEIIAVTTAETTAETTPAPASEPTPDLIEARFSADCWIEIRYKDGQIEQKIYTDQDVLTVDVKAIERLVFGNAAAVQASRQSEPFDIMIFAGRSNVARIAEDDLTQANLD